LWPTHIHLNLLYFSRGLCIY